MTLTGAVQQVGFVLELLGLFVAGWGLWRTWAEHAGGAAFGPQLRAELGDMVRRLLRRPRPTTVHGVAAGAIARMNGFAYGSVRLADGATIEQRLEHLQEQVDAAGLAAAKAQHHSEQVDRRLGERADELERRVETVRADVAGRLRDQVLNGLPTAVLGVAITAIGTLLQGNVWAQLVACVGGVAAGAWLIVASVRD